MQEYVLKMDCGELSPAYFKKTKDQCRGFGRHCNRKEIKTWKTYDGAQRAMLNLKGVDADIRDQGRIKIDKLR